jgi:3-oxoadipate enol-lactonase
MPFATVNSVKLHYELQGQGHPVVLIHPVGLDLTCWTEQVEVLAPVFRVLRVDLRGHGRSDVPPPPYTLGGLAADVHALLHHLALFPAHVIGLSVGGMVAQHLALEYPQDVSALVLADTNSTLPEEARPAMIERGEMARREGMASVVDSTLRRWFTEGFLPSAVVARCRERLLADDVTGWAATWRAISELDTEARLKEIAVPTLVITGELDVSAPVTRAQVMADLIPGALLHVVPGAPHMSPLEQPQLFAAPVLKFLRGRRRTG